MLTETETPCRKGERKEERRGRKGENGEREKVGGEASGKEENKMRQKE